MGFNRRQFFLWSTASVIATVSGCGARKGGSVLIGNNLVSGAVGDSATRSIPPESSSPLLAPKRSGVVRWVVISDLNSQYGSTTYEPEVEQVIRLIPDWQPDLVLCGGDMVAGQKLALSDDQVQAMWDAFDRHIRQPLADAKIPLGFTIGNHDGSGAIRSGGLLFERDRSIARTYWTDPAHDPGLTFVDRTHFPFYYTFAQNDIFYLSWDASTAAISAEQLTWVEQSLRGSEAQTAKRRIAIGHLPLYPVAVGRDRPGEFLNGGDTLQALLEQYDVHTYISGHNHAYYPGHKGALELLYSGAVGGGPRQLLGSDAAAQKTVTIVEISLDAEQTTYTTYRLPDLEPIAYESLPPMIQSSAGRVQRRDLVLDN